MILAERINFTNPFNSIQKSFSTESDCWRGRLVARDEAAITEPREKPWLNINMGPGSHDCEPGSCARSWGNMALQMRLLLSDTV